MNKPIPAIAESAEELRHLYRQAQTPFARQRLQALYLLKSGQAHTRQAVAALLGVHRATVGEWLRLYAQQGLAGLLQRRTAPGARPTLSATQQAQLQARLQQPEGFSSYREIQDWLVTQFALHMPYSTVFSLVHDRLGARPKVARPCHEKKKPTAALNFVAQFASQVTALSASAPPATQSVRLWAVDESRFGLQTIQRRRITARGVTPIGLTQMAFENFWLYGAVCPSDGAHFTQLADKLNAPSFQTFLEAFAQRYETHLNILLLDNSRAHHAKTLVIPSNVRLLFLPTYSPELNPIERWWRALKDQLGWWRGSLADLQQAVTQLVATYSAAAIQSLTGFAYFVLPPHAPHAS